MVESLGLPVFTAGEEPSAVVARTLGQVDPPVGNPDKPGKLDGPSGAATSGSGAATSGSGRGKKRVHQPFVFSEGFPPVPGELVGKILNREFVDMAELLRDNIEAERRRGQNDGASRPKQNRREVPDLLSWIQCFGIYVSVTASEHPERVSKMLAYQTTLVREARRCGGGGWLAYDMAFRQQAATSPETDWSKLNSSLYAVTFMAQANGKGLCCQHCFGADHTGVDCAISPTPRVDRQQRPVGLGLPVRPVLPARPTVEGRGEPRSGFQVGFKPRSRRQDAQRPQICYSFNDGECRFPHTCRYLHVCQRCQASDHPACRCPSFPAGKNREPLPR